MQMPACMDRLTAAVQVNRGCVNKSTGGIQNYYSGNSGFRPPSCVFLVSCGEGDDSYYDVNESFMLNVCEGTHRQCTNPVDFPRYDGGLGYFFII